MSFIHPSSDIADCKIGDGTNIWQYVVILKGASIGKDCNICAHVLIEGDVEIGNQVTIKSGVYVWDGLRIQDNVFVGPSVTFTNDIFPRSKEYSDIIPKTEISEGASIGANATILAGVKIGKSAMIGAGAVVVKDVPDYAVVVGNPGKVIRYIQK